MITKPGTHSCPEPQAHTQKGGCQAIAPKISIKKTDFVDLMI